MSRRLHTLKLAAPLAVFALSLALSQPSLAGDTSGDIPVNVTIQKKIKFEFTGNDKFDADISKDDFKKKLEKVWNNKGQIKYTINVPWAISVRRLMWTGPKGWDPNQDANLKFLIKTDHGYGSEDWFLVPVDPAGKWFGSQDDFGKDKTAQIDFKVNWADVPTAKRIGGKYKTMISFTIYQDGEP